MELIHWRERDGNGDAACRFPHGFRYCVFALLFSSSGTGTGTGTVLVRGAAFAILNGACGMQSELVDARWTSVMTACAPLLPAFANLRLSLRATEAARAMDLPNVTVLQRWLMMHHLPRFKELRDWYFVVAMVERFDDEATLGKWAMRQGISPSSYYRHVFRVTGHSWSEVKALGVGWARVQALNAWSLHLS